MSGSRDCRCGKSSATTTTTFTREGHPDAFHKHVFSNRTWREVEVIHIGRENFPTLAEVIDELYAWWLENRDDTLVYF